MEQQELRHLCRLIQHAANKDSVENLLRSKELPFSADNWDDLLESRVIPQVLSGRIASDDLLQVLRDAEEHGRQHVFLYRCKPDVATSLVSSDHVVKSARARGLGQVISQPQILDKPEVPTVSEIRLSGSGKDKNLVVKVVETRQFREKLEESQEGDLITRVYKVTNERAVNLAKLSASGLLEIRIASHRNSSEYAKDLSDFIKNVAFVIPIAKFAEVSLSRAKQKLATRDPSLEKTIRLSTSSLQNDYGTRLSAAASGEQIDLFSDNAARHSLVNFIDESDAYCSECNFWLIKQHNGIPSADLHVLLKRGSNEFAVTMKCSAAEYDYTITKIRQLNK